MFIVFCTNPHCAAKKARRGQYGRHIGNAAKKATRHAGADSSGKANQRKADLWLSALGTLFGSVFSIPHCEDRHLAAMRQAVRQTLMPQKCCIQSLELYGMACSKAQCTKRRYMPYNKAYRLHAKLQPQCENKCEI
jgi:hypothetical protein